MEVSGKIKVIETTQQVSDSFKKRELVVTTDEQYPQHISIGFVQDKCDLLNNFNVGDDVTVSINLRGREWVNPKGETKYFNDIQGWRIVKFTEGSNITVNEPVFEPATNYKEEEHDDLPF
jgi:hypothetical protein